jgi:hypothetical protein
MSEIFVLLATFGPDPDSIPNEIWAFSDQAAAESFLRGWSADFLGGFTHDVNDLPPDAELVAAFRNAGARVRLYACRVDGSSEELVPFEYATEPA